MLLFSLDSELFQKLFFLKAANGCGQCAALVESRFSYAHFCGLLLT